MVRTPNDCEGVMSDVTIVDYGVGNLNSIARALIKAGGRPNIVSDPDRIRSADRLLLPGVGAFGPCSRKLRETGLAEPVIEFAQSGSPFLGICVGMQLLFECSLEFGCHQGLGILQGRVEAIPPDPSPEVRRKVPHIGWSVLELPSGRTGWEETVLAGVEEGKPSMYFVHSYGCRPMDDSDRLADVSYRGYRICAAVQRENVIGFQSHPEKSGPTGLAILANFLQR